MSKTLVQAVAKPLSRRLGTAAASAVVAYGASNGVGQDVEQLVAMVVTALCGIAFDLVASSVDRRKTERDLLSQFFSGAPE